jgi:hypothetical protein
MRERLIVVSGAIVLAVVLTWPIAARIGSAGRVDTSDGAFSIWNVAWVAHAFTTDPANLYNANIFAPHQGALAYSEANIVAGVLAIPVWVATHNPYAAMNSVILLSFVLSALAMYALVKHLTGSRAAAARSGIGYAFCAYAFAHIPHIQLLMTFGPPLALLRLHLFVDAPGWRRAIWLGLAVAVQGLACGYYGLYGGIAVVLGVVWLGAWSGRWRSPSYWGFTLVACAVAIAVVLPFFVPYLNILEDGFVRTMDDARLYRANWGAYLASALILHRWMLPLIGTWREVLFPGYLAILLSIVAIAHAIGRQTRSTFPAGAHVLVFYLLLGGLALWASFGPDAGLYALLYKTVPMMSMLRAPARFGFFVTVSLQVAAGLGLASLARRWTGRRRDVLLASALIYTIVRSIVGLSLSPVPAVAVAYKRLATMPKGAVVEFPYFSAAADRPRHTEYMLMSVFHWQPLINGYSDHIPPDAFQDMQNLALFPASDAWDVLRRRQARYVLVHWNKLRDDERRRLTPEAMRTAVQLQPLIEAPDVSLYLVNPDAILAHHLYPFAGTCADSAARSRAVPCGS